MQIHLSNISTNAIIGIHDWERKNPQPLFIDVILDYDASQASSTDDINHAVDYDSLTRVIIDYTQQSRHHLLESCVEKILDLIFTTHHNITYANVTIRKPKALEPMADFAAVTQERYSASSTPPELRK